MFKHAQLSPMGDRAMIVRLGEGVDPQTHRSVKLLTDYLAEHPFDGLIETIPAFNSVTIEYDPLTIYQQESQRLKGREEQLQLPLEIVERRLREALGALREGQEPQSRLVRIPVCYGGEFGEDLAHVAELNGLTPEEVIAIHSGREYLVYMIGFAPGFPYLGGMDSRIAAPRRSTPRLSIPPGTVGIAGEQTGIYPIGTPGGWQLIGRSPLALFLPEQEPPTLLQAGDRIRFEPITREEYDQWRE